MTWLIPGYFGVSVILYAVWQGQIKLDSETYQLVISWLLQ